MVLDQIRFRGNNIVGQLPDKYLYLRGDLQGPDPGQKRITNGTTWDIAIYIGSIGVSKRAPIASLDRIRTGFFESPVSFVHLAWAGNGNTLDCFDLEREKEIVNLVDVPLNLIDDELLYGDVVVIRDVGSNDPSREARDPGILTSFDGFFIPEFPKGTRSDDISAP